MGGTSKPTDKEVAMTLAIDFLPHAESEIEAASLCTRNRP